MSDLNFKGLSDKQLRLFAVRCARRVQHLMTDPRSIAALDVVERYVRGEATDKELAAAEVAAWTAADSATATDSAWAAADSATQAARAADAADSATQAAREASSAARYASRAAELAEQQKILNEIRQEQQK